MVQDELKQYGFQLRNEFKSTNSSAHVSLVQSHEMHQVSTEDADDQPGSKRADVVWSTLPIFMRKKSAQHTAYLNYNKSNLVDNTESRGWQKHWPKRHSQPHLLLLWSNVNHGIVWPITVKPVTHPCTPHCQNFQYSPHQGFLFPFCVLDQTFLHIEEDTFHSILFYLVLGTCLFDQMSVSRRNNSISCFNDSISCF